MEEPAYEKAFFTITGSTAVSDNIGTDANKGVQE
jgi:hypothetical protein